MTAKEVILLTESRGFRLIAEASTESWGDYTDDFDMMLQSFRID